MIADIDQYKVDMLKAAESRNINLMREVLKRYGRLDLLRKSDSEIMNGFLNRPKWD